MIAAYTQAAAPGWTAASNAVRKACDNATRRNAVSCVADACHKDSEVSATSQLSLFDDLGNPAADTSEMALFFDSVRPHLEGLKASDRLSVLSSLYWLKAGEDRETLSALLRKPLRAVFEGIIDKVKI